MSRIKILSLVLVFSTLLVLPVAGMAADDGQENIYIGPDEVINSNLFKAGNVVTIEGAIKGDLFVAGNMISIKGPVAGSVFAAGNNVVISGDVGGSVFAAGSAVTISGQVAGSVRSAGSNVTINSQITENVFAAGSNIILGSESSVGWDVMLAGASLAVDGHIFRNAEFYGASVVLSNDIAGNVKAEISDGDLSLMPSANIGGNLLYKSFTDDQLNIQDGAVIAGEKVFEAITRAEKGDQKFNFKKALSPWLAFWKLISFISLLIIGLLMIALVKKPTKEIIDSLVESPMASIGWGLIIFIVTPVLALLLAMTVIGLPLSALMMMMYIISLCLAKLVAGIAIGGLIINAINKKKQPNLILALIVGLVVFFILISLPYVGWLIKLIAIWWGLGALMMYKKVALKKLNE